MGFPWNFVTALGFKNRMMPPPDGRKSVTMCIPSDTVPALDRQTDGGNWYKDITLRMHCMLMRDKKDE